MTTAMTTLSGIPKIAAALVRYVRDTPAPEPTSVMLYPDKNAVDIQPSHGPDPVQTIGSLLIWTHRLTGITGEWWRTPGGDLFTILTGRGPHGITYGVYGAIPYRAVQRLVRLPQGERESVTPDELYQLALELRTRQEI
ncbi:hypothetical protein [Amycolatopsis sp.]|uniref:hypothetical protein n=1 Tax=Amycolatopsis sp. TaxID=37632 RepID=UPI002C2DAB21|nr:hypothetical protein [Amycolatopsis sp.]HVV09221.1 hypothetical protein [Amycolatopsis sp.]